MLSTPGRARHLRSAGVPYSPVGSRGLCPSNTPCGCADALVPHRCPQAVHGRRGVLPGSAPAWPPICISAGQQPSRAAVRVVRRSADRRGRPSRRDPDVRRGAGATLTAPSTARQRSGCPAGRVGSACRRRQKPCRVDHERSGSARPPATAVPRLCWLESVDGSGRPPARAVRRCRWESVWSRVTVTSFRGRRGTAHRRPSRSPRARSPTGGCAPSMSCSGSTS
jgi:hypothetical protein